MTCPPTTVDICMCTYRRESVVRALASLDAQRLPEGVGVRVIVADNDDGPSARERVEAAAAGMRVPVTYLHAPSGNISVARNACLDAATATWVAFIDDDGIADADWLATLLEHAHTHGVDAVFGPALARYGADAPGWVRELEPHSNHPKRRHGEVQTGHTCNALLRRAHERVVGERFRLEKGRSGGEDTEFFHRLWHRGVRLGICVGAKVYEPVEPARLAWRWMARRRFQGGHSWGGSALHRPSPWARARQAALAMFKVQACLAAGLLVAPSARRRNAWLLRGVFHVGVIAGSVGVPEDVVYGGIADPPPAAPVPP